MIAQWFYIAAAFCFMVGTVLNMQPAPESNEEDKDEAEPFGFRVYDGGVRHATKMAWRALALLQTELESA